MKAFVTGLLKGRITRRRLLAAVLPAAGVSLAWAGEGSDEHGRDDQHPQSFKLGGGFIGHGGGLVFDAKQIPLDPAGRTAALHLKVHTWSPGLAGVLAQFGADTMTEATGEMEMTGRDTFKVCWVAYGTQQGNPPLIRAIFVLTGTAQWSTPDSYVINNTLDVYDASADADKDGFPDTGTTPGKSITGINYGNRVPLP